MQIGQMAVRIPKDSRLSFLSSELPLFYPVSFLQALLYSYFSFGFIYDTMITHEKWGMKMKQAMIATWKMAYDGMVMAKEALHEGCSVAEAIRIAIQDVEKREEFISVGHGGLPNEQGHVQLDAAYMDGNSLHFGGIIEVENVASPIAVAQHLCGLKCNCLLAGKGAEAYAQEHGFAFQNHLCEASRKRWEAKRQQQGELKAYEGHDTVCVLAKQGSAMGAGVSTSGLFMKHAGRVGDSPIIGSGFYSDASAGSAAATGLGEDIMRGCLSIRIVDKLADGIPVQQAVDEVLDAHMKRMQEAGNACDAISLIAMDKEGNCAASTNIAQFPFVVIDDEGIKLMVAAYTDGKHHVFEADDVWLDRYEGD